MKKILFGVLFLLMAVTGYSQFTPVKPLTQPGKPDLPTPKIAPPTKADLQIIDIRMISAEVDRTARQTTVRVSITIKNNGQLTAAASKLTGFVQSGGPSGSTPPWRSFTSSLDVPAINGGQTLTAEYAFVGIEKLIGTTNFHFKALADYNNVVAESNEANNTSAIILGGIHYVN